MPTFRQQSEWVDLVGSGWVACWRFRPSTDCQCYCFWSRWAAAPTRMSLGDLDAGGGRLPQQQYYCLGNPRNDWARADSYWQMGWRPWVVRESRETNDDDFVGSKSFLFGLRKKSVVGLLVCLRPTILDFLWKCRRTLCCGSLAASYVPI